jgi:hypothetical protein
MPANLGLREVANSPLSSPKLVETHSAMSGIYILSENRFDIMDFIFVDSQALLGVIDSGP